MFAAGEWATVPLYRRDALRPGRPSTGPRSSPRTWRRPWSSPAGGPRSPSGRDLLLTRVAAARSGRCRGRAGRAAGRDGRDRGEADPVLLEVFSNLFMAVAEQMGERLRSTAHSVNIKERLDFSCAIFDADGNLIANAPHIPVHLGSMSESIKMVINRNKGRSQAGRRLRAQRPVPRRHPPPRRHRGHPRLRPPATGRGRTTATRATSGSTSPPAAITPRSAASPPARCPRQAPGSRRRASSSTTGSWSRSGRLREAETTALLTEAEYPSRNPRDQPRRPARPGRRQREGRRGTAPHGRAVRPRRGARLHGPRPGERRGGGQERHHRAQRRRLRLRARQRRAHPVKVTVDQRARTAAIDFTGTSPQLERQLQRPVERGDGRRALRVPHPGRQGHPAERRLPQAAHRDHPAGDDAVTGVPRRGRRRQRRDQPGGHRRALRRARASWRRARAR